MSKPGTAWMPGQPIAPGWLDERFYGRYAAGLVGMVISDELIVNSASEVASWPLRRASGSLVDTTANKFTVTNSGGRRMLSPGAINAKALGLNNGVAWQTVIAVAFGTPPVNAYELIAEWYDPNSNEALMRSASGVYFAGSLWTRWRNAIAIAPGGNGIPTSGLHVWHSYYSANASTGFRVGGTQLNLRTWPVPIAFAAWLNLVPTAQNIADDYADLKKYYSQLR